jgi:hypothetical protein
MLQALLVIFALIAVFGYVMTPQGQERLGGAIRYFTAPRDRARPTTRGHQLAVARAGGGRRNFGKR